MRTNIVLDDALVHEALKLSGAKTKKEIISLALKEFVGNRKCQASSVPRLATYLRSVSPLPLLL